MTDIRIGLDMGGTKIEAVAALVQDEIKILKRTRIPTQAHLGYDSLVKTVSSFITDFSAEFPNARCVGVGMPGSTREDGAIKNANTKCLNGRFFHQDVQKRVAQKLIFANDANCFALAEAVLGAGKGHQLVFGVIMGTGVGGGLVINGKFREGPHSICGEWGHTSLWPNFDVPCYCGKRGCVEQFLSGTGISMQYAQLSRQEFDLKEILRREKQGEQNASQIIEKWLDDYGRALSNVLNILDPDVVVLGGGVSNVDLLYTRGIKKVAQYLFCDQCHTPIIRHQLGDSAGVLGAALLRQEL